MQWLKLRLRRDLRRRQSGPDRARCGLHTSRFHTGWVHDPDAPDTLTKRCPPGYAAGHSKDEDSEDREIKTWSETARIATLRRDFARLIPEPRRPRNGSSRSPCRRLL